MFNKPFYAATDLSSRGINIDLNPNKAVEEVVKFFKEEFSNMLKDSREEVRNMASNAISEFTTQSLQKLHNAISEGAKNAGELTDLVGNLKKWFEMFESIKGYMPNDLYNHTHKVFELSEDILTGLNSTVGSAYKLAASLGEEKVKNGVETLVGIISKTSDTVGGVNHMVSRANADLDYLRTTRGMISFVATFLLGAFLLILMYLALKKSVKNGSAGRLSYRYLHTFETLGMIKGRIAETYTGARAGDEEGQQQGAVQEKASCDEGGNNVAVRRNTSCLSRMKESFWNAPSNGTCAAIHATVASVIGVGVGLPLMPVITIAATLAVILNCLASDKNPIQELRILP